MRKLFVVIAVLVMAAQLCMISSFVSGPSHAYAGDNYTNLLIHAIAIPRWKQLMSALAGLP